MSPIQAFLKLAGQVLDVPRRYVNREIDYPSVAPNLQANTLFHQLLDPDIEAGDVSTIGKGLPPGKAKRWREVPVDSKTDFTIAAREIKDVQKTNSGAYSGGPCVAVTTFGGITPLCSTSSLPKPTMTVWRTNNPDRAVSANMGGGTNPIDGRKMLHKPWVPQSTRLRELDATHDESLTPFSSIPITSQTLVWDMKKDAVHPHERARAPKVPKRGGVGTMASSTRQRYTQLDEPTKARAKMKRKSRALRTVEDKRVPDNKLSTYTPITSLPDPPFEIEASVDNNIASLQEQGTHYNDEGLTLLSPWPEQHIRPDLVMPSAPPILAQFPPPAAQPQSSFVVGSDEGSYNDVIPQPVIPFVDGNIWYGPSDRSAELFDYSASRAPSVVSHHTFYSLDDQWPISDTVFDDFDLAANGTKDNYDTIDPISNAPFQFTVGEGPSRNMGAYDAALSYMDDPQVGLPDVGVQYWIDKLASNPPDSTPPTPLHYDTSPHSCYFQAADMVNVTVSPNATSPSGSTLDNGSIFDMNMFQGQGMTNPEQWDYGDCGSSLTAASEHYNA